MAVDIAAKYGVPFARSAVGEANVVDTMLAERAVFGGEGSGGPIDPQVGLVRDSFVGMAHILSALAERGGSLSAWVAELPKYHIHKTSVPLESAKLSTALDAIEKHFADARADRLDGLRLDWSDRWLIVRGSNTEPIIRAIAEAPRAADSAALCAMAAAVLAKQ
jgi:phosphomannomutase